MGGERDEHLRGRQRIAIGVVGPVHRQAERARQVGEPDRLARRGRQPAEPPQLTVDRRGVDQGLGSSSPRERGRRRGSRARRAATCATSALPARAGEQAIEHLVERRRIGEVRLAKAVDADRVVARHPLRPDQLVLGVGEA